MTLSRLSKNFYIALAFTFALLAYERVFLNFQPGILREILPPLAITGIQVLSLLVAVFFFWASFVTSVFWRAASLLLFIASCLTEYGYAYAYGRFSIVQDYFIGVNTFTVGIIRNALEAFIASQWVVFPPMIAYAALLLLTHKKTDRGFKPVGLALTTILIFFSILHPFTRGIYTTVSFSAGMRTLIFSGWDWLNTYRGSREAIDWKAGTAPVNNLILVVDESVRGDHLSLNGYGRSTTPYLESLQRDGKLANWGISAAGATNSLFSNTLLMTGIYALPDTNQDYRKKPTIFQYAKAAGYTTYVMDVQMDRQWLLSPSDLGYVDHWMPAREFERGIPGYQADFAAAREIRKVITGSSGNFIWINKSGVHFPYLSRLPAEVAQWRPIDASNKYQPDNVQSMINTYDSAIRYNLDSFFKELIADGLPENTIIIYTSDHGQTLSENGETWPHSGPTRNEAAVPLFMINDNLLAMDTSYQASHANIFATLLDLMKVPDKSRAYPYLPSLLKARESDSKHRFYYFGLIESAFNGQAFDFDRPEQHPAQ